MRRPLNPRVYSKWLTTFARRNKRDTLSEAVVSLRTVVTFVTWLISTTEFSSSKLVLQRQFLLKFFLEVETDREVVSLFA